MHRVRNICIEDLSFVMCAVSSLHTRSSNSGYHAGSICSRFPARRAPPIWIGVGSVCCRSPHRIGLLISLLRCLEALASEASLLLDVGKGASTYHLHLLSIFIFHFHVQLVHWCANPQTTREYHMVHHAPSGQACSDNTLLEASPKSVPVINTRSSLGTDGAL